MENNDLSSIISSVTSDPEMMSKLLGMASSLSASASVPEKTSENEEHAEQALAVSGGNHHSSSNRARLIAALKPYLNDDRREKADKLLSLISLLELTRQGKK